MRVTSRLRILVAEDDADIAALVKKVLERQGGAQVDVVRTGDAALRAVTVMPPDLMILDLNLPVIDGVEVCRLVRGHVATATLPIIILTARTTEGDRVACLDLGADDYVTKPFSLAGTGRARAGGPPAQPATDDVDDAVSRPAPDRRFRRGVGGRRRRSPCA